VTLVQSPVTPAATASSGLVVTFSSLTTGVCTVGGSTVTLLTTGLCTIQADQAGNAAYNAAAAVQQSFTVSKAAQTITFAALPTAALLPPPHSPITPAATASSGIVATLSSPTTRAGTTSGKTITLLTTGTCTIQADQVGNATYNAAAAVQQS